MKLCPKCEQVKTIQNFHKNKARADGYDHYCKVCRNERTRLRRSDPEALKRENEHTREYRKKPEIKARDNDYARHYYQRDADFRKKRIEYAREYRKTQKGQEVKQKVKRAYFRNHYDKHLARTVVHQAVKSGKLRHPSELICNSAGCNNQAAEYHHHNGYDKSHRLDVVPMCEPCHDRIHWK